MSLINNITVNLTEEDVKKIISSYVQEQTGRTVKSVIIEIGTTGYGYNEKTLINVLQKVTVQLGNTLPSNYKFDDGYR
jgi:hypothetical protein